MAKVLVIGASRVLGFEAVSAALRAGHSVRVLARSAASIRIQDAGLNKVSADALDRDTIRNALQVVDVVIQTLGVHFSPRVIFEGTLGIDARPGRFHEGRRREAPHCGDWSRRRRQPRSHLIS